jgi:hypothetical protein
MEEERILGDPMGDLYEVPQRGPERYGVGCVAAVGAGLFGGEQCASRPLGGDTVGMSSESSLGIATPGYANVQA